MEIEELVTRLKKDSLQRFSDRLNRRQMSILVAHFEWSVGRIVRRQAAKNAGVIDVGLDAMMKIDHVVDWMLSSLFERADWLQVRDEKGRPRKLMKCGTIDALHKEAEKWFRIQANKPRITALSEGHEDLFMDLGEGWRMVRMRTPESLDLESQEMGICIGAGSYDWYLRGNERFLLSLRDIRNKPHVTVDLDMRTNSMVEIRGKNNSVPNPEYLAAMKPFFKLHGHVSGDRVCGLIFGFDGDAYFIDAIPEGAVLRSICRAPNGSSYLDRLPNGVKAIGKHDLTGISLSNFFKGRHTGVEFIGDTDISYSSGVKLLPKVHPFRGNLIIKGTDLTGFESGFYLDGSLRIENCKDFEALPSNFHIGGNLSIFDCPLRSLPAEIRVDGDLLVSGCKVRKVSPAARVAGKARVLW